MQVLRVAQDDGSRGVPRYALRITLFFVLCPLVRGEVVHPRVRVEAVVADARGRGGNSARVVLVAIIFLIQGVMKR